MLFFFVIAASSLFGAKITKQFLVYKGIQNSGGIWELVFADKRNKVHLFDAKSSNTFPYVFFSTAADGSLSENEKVRGSWFWVRNDQVMVGKILVKRITNVGLVKTHELK